MLHRFLHGPAGICGARRIPKTQWTPPLLMSEVRAYDIVPVDARTSLINNGGVHCVFGILRAPQIPAGP